LLKESVLEDLLARVRHALTVRSRFARELIVIGVGLLLGLVLVPLAIWFVGNRILGPYTQGNNLHSGPMALLGDFFSGLSQGWLSYWIVALGPLAIILFVRGAWALINPNSGAPDIPASVESNRRIEPTVSKDRL
jgi:hypothetical protein